jgi:hypothetical protein
MILGGVVRTRGSLLIWPVTALLTLETTELLLGLA